MKLFPSHKIKQLFEGSFGHIFTEKAYHDCRKYDTSPVAFNMW